MRSKKDLMEGGCIEEMDQAQVGFPGDSPHESSKETPSSKETIYEGSLCLRKRCQEEKHESKTQFLLCNDSGQGPSPYIQCHSYQVTTLPISS